MAKHKFLIEYLKNPFRVGAVLPSSLALIERMTPGNVLSRARRIVELGAGQGNVTAAILAKSSSSVRIESFEIHPPFAAVLRGIGDERLRIHEKDVRHLREALGQERADVVISGLPLASWSSSARGELFRAVRDILVPRGHFVQFSYAPFYLDELKKGFSEVATDFVAWNIPPAFVFTCRN